jgi:hypothetical protein
MARGNVLDMGCLIDARPIMAWVRRVVSNRQVCTSFDLETVLAMGDFLEGKEDEF